MARQHRRKRRHSVLRDPSWSSDIEKVELPTAAVEHARRLAQRGTTVNALVRAYRLGHKAVLDEVLDEVCASALEPPLSFAVFSQISESRSVTSTGSRNKW